MTVVKLQSQLKSMEATNAMLMKKIEELVNMFLIGLIIGNKQGDQSNQYN